MKEKTKKENMKEIWNEFWEYFYKVSFQLYKYSFILGILFAFNNVMFGTILLIMLLTGFFNSKVINEREENNKDVKKI